MLIASKALTMCSTRSVCIPVTAAALGISETGSHLTATSRFMWRAQLMLSWDVSHNYAGLESTLRRPFVDKFCHVSYDFSFAYVYPDPFARNISAGAFLQRLRTSETSS